MARINKTAEVLSLISKRKVISLTEILSSKQLSNLYFNSKATPKRRIIDTLVLLAKNGFVSVGQIDNETIYKITVKGRLHLDKYHILKQSIPPVKDWNKNWYLITFDIPDHLKGKRNQLILYLKSQGFINYTKGIWLYPFDPSDYISSLKKKLGLSREIKMIVAYALDDEKRFRKLFNLV